MANLSYHPGVRTISVIVGIGIIFGIPTAVQADCGDRGGPGYRGPNGQCVSWVSVGKVCGCPPTTMHGRADAARSRKGGGVRL